jgi:hypothetical protein
MGRSVLLFLFLLPCLRCFSQAYNSDTTLLIVGSFSLKNNLNRNIHIKLYAGDLPVDSMIVSGNQEFGFYLRRNANFTIVITKDGFVKKTIAVSTELPDNVKPKTQFNFGFTVPLVREPTEGNEDKYIKYLTPSPIAHVFYNAEIKKFDSIKARQAAKEKQ